MKKSALASLALAVAISVQTGTVAFANEPAGDQAKTAKEFKAPDLALKVDRYDKDQLPRNFRTCKDELAGLTRDGVMPSVKGLKDENVSASSCFSEKELEKILNTVPTTPDKFYDIDLRLESHGYLDGMAVSWYSYKDWGNDGWDPATAKHRETDQLNDAMKKKPIEVYTFNDDSNEVGAPIYVISQKASTEEQMVKKHGAHYFRIAIPDHFRPADAQVDQFLAFYKQLPKDAWLHYHCYAGMGRTTIFMIMHDILKSAPQGVSFDDIIKRQYLLGKVDLSAIPDKKQNWERQLYIERYRFTKQFYDYVCAHPKLDMRYQEWTKQHNYTDGAVNYQGFVWRRDAEDVAELPRNFRTCQSPYTSATTDQVAPFMENHQNPTRKGLDTLDISGSAEMSRKGFAAALTEIKKYAKGPIYDVDLRQESHGYFDGTPVSWYGLRDWGNADKNEDLALIQKDEKMRLKAAQNSKDGVVTADLESGAYDKYATNVEKRNVQKTQTEEELAKELGVNYFRIPARDHLWPSPAMVDRFMDFYKTLPENAWLHFHCEAGAGRTTAFMVMTDILENPDVSLEDILARQYLIGGNYTAYTIANPKPKEYKAQYYWDKARMVKWFYRYVQENKAAGFAVPWSAWIAENDQVGD